MIFTKLDEFVPHVSTTMKMENGYPWLFGNTTIWLHIALILKSMNLIPLDETFDKDVDRVHTYENQLKVGEQVRVWPNESKPTNVDLSLIDVVRT